MQTIPFNNFTKRTSSPLFVDDGKSFRSFLLSGGVNVSDNVFQGSFSIRLHHLQLYGERNAKTDKEVCEIDDWFSHLGKILPSSDYCSPIPFLTRYARL